MINMDEKCGRCGKLGAGNNGICLECTLYDISKKIKNSHKQSKKK